MKAGDEVRGEEGAATVVDGLRGWTCNKDLASTVGEKHTEPQT